MLSHGEGNGSVVLLCRKALVAATGKSKGC